MTQQPNAANPQDAAWADLAARVGDLMGDPQAEAAAAPAAPSPDVTQLQGLVDERTADLQRVQAEYVNYKKRVDRDRSLARQSGVESVVRDLMPVLDSVQLSRAHGELDGGFKVVADELTRLAGKYGLTAFGEVGEEFDPHKHEALMQVPTPGDGEMSLHEVLQRGYEMNGVVLRPARVIVAMPDGSEPVGATTGQASAPTGQPDAPGAAESDDTATANSTDTVAEATNPANAPGTAAVEDGSAAEAEG